MEYFFTIEIKMKQKTTPVNPLVLKFSVDLASDISVKGLLKKSEALNTAIIEKA